MPSIIKKLSGRARSSKPIELLSPKPFVPPRPVQNGNLNHDIHQELAAAAAEVNSSPKWKVFRTVNKPPKSVRAPRLRYNRTPVRQTVGGEWALRQCEEHTTWVNGILKEKHLPVIGDLRKSIGDGTTLVILTEGVCRRSVPNVNVEIDSKEDRVYNITKCLEVLGSTGVDLTAIDGEDLADGNLKTTLMLVGNIRQHFEKEQNYAPVNQTELKEKKMPGAITLPGNNGVREPPLGVTDEKTTYQRRIIIPAEDLLPGTMGKEEVRPTTPGLPGMLTSTTEIGMNGVSQSGVEERRQQQVRFPPRPHSAKPIPSPKPPGRGQGVTNAWGDVPQTGMPLSVEDRLKSLITGPPTPRTAATNNKSFEDGELIQPPPRPKSAIPFDQTGRAYNDIPKYGGKGQQSYIPSRPNERWQGSRADALIDRQLDQSPVRPPDRPLRAGGQDNPAFMPEMQLNRSRESLGPPSSGMKTGSELRDAWNKLYGGQIRPESRGPTSYPSENQLHVRPDSLGVHKNFPDHRGIMHTRPDTHGIPQVRPDPHGLSRLEDPMPHVVPQNRLDDPHSVHQNRMEDQQAKPSSYPSHFHVKFPSTPAYNEISNKPGASQGGRHSPLGQSSSAGTQGQGSNTSFQYNGNGNKVLSNHVSFQTFGKPTSNQKLSVSSSPTSPASPPGIALGPSSKYPDYGEKSAKVKQGYNTSYDLHNHKDIDDDRDILDMKSSIFDYNSEPSSRSVTPPLPPLSASNSDYSSNRSSPQISPQLPRSNSATHLSSTKTPDLVTSATRTNGEKRIRRASGSQFTYRADKKSKQKQTSKHVSSGIKAGMLSDVRESGNESDLPFDIEDTILTVDSHDAEPMNMHDNLASNDINRMRDQLNNLEEMYQQMSHQIGSERDIGTVKSRRRWSLGSSDTNSLQRPISRKFKSGAGGQRPHHHHHRDVKAINKRFQRLESHVVTLARSVAHLSSELRSHNSVTHEIDALRKEIQELKEEQFMSSQRNRAGNFYENDFERFRGWVPSLTNPRRVNKLTKFFGQEPPLLNIFLKKLGYEKYSVNFEKEHIGMIELPYMTEERLEKIGVPMGPRLRILQEAQLCFRQENFNIYIV
ncbi:uncharacterized protein LOC127698642 isoform X3 [Mytilus californianus]|uniref:uncharacterized protein LOC127698642 isoform X3 n=1 Tax=Mytilus californianus TaxID=6549 RepID=UPI002247CF14|nr:uncharacterized protein LOC127698642 isoform X3 [Mytilus californianus]